MDSSVGLVRRGYDEIAEAYAASRDRFANLPYLERLLTELPGGATVLDVGCGSGVPVDRFLVDRGSGVTGIDISQRQIRLASANVPEAAFAVRDMTSLDPHEYHVDAVVSFYAIFHTPRDGHASLLRIIASFLNPNGWLLVTMAAQEWEGTQPDFHGAQMYWSHFGAPENRRLVEQAGFRIAVDEIDAAGGERHQVLLAQRRPAAASSEMRAEDVLEFLDICKANAITIWLDGGWGVDALLREQTRRHDDLDIVVQRKDRDRLRTLLGEQGFIDAPGRDSYPWVFVMADSCGREIDFHVIEIDARGAGLYGSPDDGVEYPAASLTGSGEVGRAAVRCISPEWQVRFHSGYILDDNDHRDLAALCARFDIPLPGSIPEHGTRWRALRGP